MRLRKSVSLEAKGRSIVDWSVKTDWPVASGAPWICRCCTASIRVACLFVQWMWAWLFQDLAMNSFWCLILFFLKALEPCTYRILESYMPYFSRAPPNRTWTLYLCLVTMWMHTDSWQICVKNTGKAFQKGFFLVGLSIETLEMVTDARAPSSLAERARTCALNISLLSHKVKTCTKV